MGEARLVGRWDMLVGQVGGIGYLIWAFNGGFNLAGF